MGAAAAAIVGVAAMNDAQAVNGDGALQSIGGAIGSTIKGIGEDTSKTFTGLAKTTGDKLFNAPSVISNTPLAPGTTAGQVMKQITTGDLTGLTKSIQNITRLPRRVFPQDAVPHRQNIGKVLTDAILSIRRMVAQELRDCIEKWLNYLRNRYRIFDILWDLEGWIHRQIMYWRNRLRRFLDDLLGRANQHKTDRYQIHRYLHIIRAMLRKLCPKLPHNRRHRKYSNDHSPAWIRRLQTDPTWKIVDGVTPVSTLAAANADTAAAIEDPNNAGQVFEKQINATMESVIDEIEVQQVGFNNASASDFVNVDLTTPAIGSGTGDATVNIDNIINSLIAKFSALGLSNDEICDRIVATLGESYRDKICALVQNICG